MDFFTGHDLNNDGKNDLYIRHTVSDEEVGQAILIMVAIAILGFIGLVICVLILEFMEFGNRFGWMRIAGYGSGGLLAVGGLTLAARTRRRHQRSQQLAMEQIAREREKKRVENLRLLTGSGNCAIRLSPDVVGPALMGQLQVALGLTAPQAEQLARQAVASRPLATGDERDMELLAEVLKFYR